MRLEGFKNDVSIDTHTKHANVLVVEFDRVRSGWEQWILLRSDAHQDNIHARRDIEERHLDLALERNAIILDFGDLFCAMQGRGDPRSSYDSLRPEHKRDDYINALVETAASRYGKYARNWLLLGKGNHETAVIKNRNFDLTSALAATLNTKNKGACVSPGGYGGWVRFLFTVHKTRRTSINLKYHHGWGGGGPVTRGVIDTNRQGVYQPDAHVVVNGHVHENYILPIARERLSMQGVISQDVCWFVRTPTYKDEYGDGSGGFHIEKGRGPKVLGCVWGRFYYEADQVNMEFTSMVQ